MNPTEMVRSIVILSGSTLSRLFKTTNYEEMEQKMFKGGLLGGVQWRDVLTKE
jgi:hypothetical protein